MAALNNQIILTDGRALGFAEYGDPKGWPVMYFHGWPSSRLEAGMVADSALKLRLRVNAPDRPGFGRSDFQPGRQLVDWPVDVIELADALELDRFSVLGLSGGGLYAAVCASKVPSRLHAVGFVRSQAPADVPGVLDSMLPLNRRLLQIGCLAPWLFRLISWRVVQGLRSDPDEFFAQTLNDLPGPDRDVMARAEIRKHFQDAALEAFRRDSQGAALENALYARPWGFRLQDITKQVHLWHGELDINNSPGMGRYLDSAIPGCSAQFYEAEGHASLFVNQMEEILRTLSSATVR